MEAAAAARMEEGDRDRERASGRGYGRGLGDPHRDRQGKAMGLSSSTKPDSFSTTAAWPGLWSRCCKCARHWLGGAANRMVMVSGHTHYLLHIQSGKACRPL